MQETREDFVKREMFLDERLHVSVGLSRSRRRFFPVDRLSESTNGISSFENGDERDGMAHLESSRMNDQSITHDCDQF